MKTRYISLKPVWKIFLTITISFMVSTIQQTNGNFLWCSRSQFHHSEYQWSLLLKTENWDKYILTTDHIPEIGFLKVTLILNYFLSIWIFSQVDSVNKKSSDGLITGFLLNFSCDINERKNYRLIIINCMYRMCFSKNRSELVLYFLKK